MLMELLPMLAETTGAAVDAAAASAGGLAPSVNFGMGVAGGAAALGVGMVGAKAAEAVGRNPTAFGNILTISIIGMALAEAIAIYALVVVFVKG